MGCQVRAPLALWLQNDGEALESTLIIAHQPELDYL